MDGRAQVLERFEAWLAKHALLGKDARSFAIVTDGPWDMRDFFQKQCAMCDIRVRPIYQRWVNIRMVRRQAHPSGCRSEGRALTVCVPHAAGDAVRGLQTFADHFRQRWLSLAGMLQQLSLEFEGSPHSGIDDSRNVARIARELVRYVAHGAADHGSGGRSRAAPEGHRRIARTGAAAS